MKDAIAETREQIARLQELEDLHEMTLAGFRSPGGHGLLKKFEEESEQ
jgi:hypothetical protein